MTPLLCVLPYFVHLCFITYHSILAVSSSQELNKDHGRVIRAQEVFFE